MAGVPPYNISKIFDKTFRILFNFSKRGTPSGNGHVMGHIAEQAADAAAETERSVAMNILAGNKSKRENEERDL